MRNLHVTFDTVKSKVKISHNFVAFSEYMNFKEIKGKSKYKASNDNNQNLAGGKMFRFWCKQNNGNVLPVRSKLIDEHKEMLGCP